jgi:ABC-2 type transport system permease protein
VLDPRNTAFPVPVQRQVQGFTIQETRLVNYPYFVDIRPDGMNQESGMLSGLNQITMNWASPILVDKEKNKDRKVVRLLESSADSWLSDSTGVQPDFTAHGELGFPAGTERDKQLLGVMVEGRFTSYFAGKPSPLLASPETPEDSKDETGTDASEEDLQVISRQLDRSPESARIILFGSNSFLNDVILGIGSSVMQSSYLGPVQLIANGVDWSLEDRGLLSIRGRGHFSRPLLPMNRQVQFFWEYLNYGLALAGLALVWLLNRSSMKKREHLYRKMVQ